MSQDQLSPLDHLLPVFGSRARLESMEEELRIAARHSGELSEHLRTQLAAGALEQPAGLLTAAGARHLVAIHDQNAATCIALADPVNHALCPPAEESGLRPLIGASCPACPCSGRGGQSQPLRRARGGSVPPSAA